MNLPNIYEYNDFRKFLVDYQRCRFEGDKTFSASYICKKLGLPRTRSYFRDVINGKRVTKTFLERFIHLLEFDKDEAMFFRALVQFNQASNCDEREFYFDQLISLNKTPKKILDRSLFELYKEWHHSAIRAILDIYDFKDDYTALGKKIFPPISAKKAEESIALLLKLGLIKKNTNGFYKPTEKSISTGSYIQNELIKQYQMKCIDLARIVLLKNRKKPQNISTNTISISETGYKRLEKKLQQFKAEIRSMVHKDEHPADRVYQFNIQLFPTST